MTTRVFGEIDGISEGALFSDRTALAAAGIHRPTQAGISGAAKEGADSIVLSGGYEDDEDFGDEIIYTGHGGQNADRTKQIQDQELTRQNLALAVSCQQGLPVRVSRGGKHDSRFSPASGYQYAGLYRIEDYWHEPGVSGFEVWRFRLVKVDGATTLEPTGPDASTPSGTKKTRRVKTTVSRVIRDTSVSRDVKKIHDFTCQVCGIRLEGPAGGYAEGAHIRPLGQPHNGPDTTDNILCLCPNHHWLFDYGAFGISDDFKLIGQAGELRTSPKHAIDVEQLSYHRNHFGLAAKRKK